MTHMFIAWPLSLPVWIYMLLEEPLSKVISVNTIKKPNTIGSRDMAFSEFPVSAWSNPQSLHLGSEISCCEATTVLSPCGRLCFYSIVISSVTLSLAV